MTMHRLTIKTVFSASAILSIFLTFRFHNASYVRHLANDSTSEAWEPLIQNQTTNFTVENDGISSCFSLNSMEWLTSERYGNQKDMDSLGDTLVASSILDLDKLLDHDDDLLPRLIGHSVCHKDSKLSSPNLLRHNAAEISQEDLFVLSVRLIYAAVHIHQHRHALQEAKQRLKMSPECETTMQHHNIGPFDFECPDAKFLVVPMKHRGLGAVMRTDVAPALMAGIVTDRVILFMNNLGSGPTYLQSPWAWASCPRYDKQCFFLPDSPCVVTHQDIANATVLEKGERRKLFKTGELPGHARNARVVVMDMATRPQRTPPNLRQELVKIIHEHVVTPITTHRKEDARLDTISTAIDYILQEDETAAEDSFGYYGKSFGAHTAMILYAMRPNMNYSKRLEEMTMRTFANTVSSESMMLGLPIRASDKCGTESECPSFDLYMDLIGTLWEQSKHLATPSKNVSIILTSESPGIHQARQNYQARSSLAFPSDEAPFEFVTNDLDVVQNSGDPKALSVHNTTKEGVLLSTLGSLKMQLHSQFAVGNCCSNHHLMLMDILKAGCGAHHHTQVAQCMQDHEDPKYRLCCAWTKTPECLERRRA